MPCIFWILVSWQFRIWMQKGVFQAKLQASFEEKKSTKYRCRKKSVSPTIMHISQAKLYYTSIWLFWLFWLFLITFWPHPGYNLAIFLKAFKIFIFSTEKVRRLRNREGWDVGVWEGISLDQSKLCWVSVHQSKQNPNKSYGWRCSTILPDREGEKESQFATNTIMLTND